MKKVVILFLGILIFEGCGNSAKKVESSSSKNSTQTFKLDTSKLKSGEVYYQCEMHPEIISDQPGNCPKCGMELLKAKKK
jgi:PBP1b-binding outer membrane lipoprotein LpoB